MNKRIVIVGVILILVAFLVGIALTPGTFNSIANTSLANISIVANGNAHLPFIVGTNGIVSVLYTSNNKLDFYFANSTAFKTLSGYQNSSLLTAQWGRRLYGNGVYEIVPGAYNGIFPNFAAQNSTLNYSYASQNSFPFAAGTYYAIFENPNNQSATVDLISSISNSTKVNAGFSQVIKIGLVFFAVFLAGIILIIYGILKKPKVAMPESPTDQKKVDALYKGVGKKSPKAKK